MILGLRFAPPQAITFRSYGPGGLSTLYDGLPFTGACVTAILGRGTRETGACLTSVMPSLASYPSKRDLLADLGSSESHLLLPGNETLDIIGASE